VAEDDTENSFSSFSFAVLMSRIATVKAKREMDKLELSVVRVTSMGDGDSCGRERVITSGIITSEEGTGCVCTRVVLMCLGSGGIVCGFCGCAVCGGV